MKKSSLAPRLSNEGWRPLRLTVWFSVHCGMQIWDCELLLPFVDSAFLLSAFRDQKNNPVCPQKSRASTHLFHSYRAYHSHRSDQDSRLQFARLSSKPYGRN